MIVEWMNRTYKAKKEREEVIISLNSLIEEVSNVSQSKFNKNQLAKHMGTSRQWVNVVLNHGQDGSPVNQVKMLLAMQDFLQVEIIEHEITINRHKNRIQEMSNLIDLLNQQINDVAMNVSEVEK